MLSTRFSSLAVNRPHSTSAFPKQVTNDMAHTAALNIGFPSKCDNDDTPGKLIVTSLHYLSIKKNRPRDLSRKFSPSLSHKYFTYLFFITI